MSAATFTLLFVLLGAIWYFLHRRAISRRKNDRKLPPGPAGLPVIGNLHKLGKLPHRSLRDLAEKYGPIMSIKLGSVPAIVVSSPQAAELFLKKHDAAFSSRPKIQASEYLFYGAKAMAFTEQGEYWRSVRKLCSTELLSGAKIDSYGGMRRQEVTAVVKSLKAAAAGGDVVDLSETVEVLAENLTCRMVFGRSSDDRFDLKGLVHEVLELAGVFNIADYLPFLGPLDLQGFTRRMKETGKAIDKTLEMIIDEHERDASRNQSQQKDFIDALLALTHEVSTSLSKFSFPIDRTNMKAIAVDMIAGSIDTSAVEIVWTMSELLRNPRVMKKLQEEIKMAVGEDRTVEETDLVKLPYLEMVIKESLRLHPVAPLLVPHESMEDVDVVLGKDCYFVPKKSRIMVNCWALGRDPKVWSENAEEFFPERFVGCDVDLQGHHFQLIPFGSGRRICPGIQLGLTTIRLVVAQLVHCFDWALPGGISPEELDMREKFGLSLPRAQHLVAIPSYRLST
ncbi:cytochrome P450 CYP736A12-like [Diospyros lotus]|uniref:cytochrome P450 CYP736A12-like n=1 Tax=Diospyros lotus TaxID=55363 RepID=UPI00225BD4DF|nr:cytochrome P450 CYP736A12-like [Diospyros lotus]